MTIFKLPLNIFFGSKKKKLANNITHTLREPLSTLSRFKLSLSAFALIGLSIVSVPASAQLQQSGETIKVYIIAGQSNAIGHGLSLDNTVPGTLAYTLINDPENRYGFIDNVSDTVDDVGIYFEHNGTVKRGNLEVGYGDNDQKIGLELSFGHKIQQYENQPVLIIKAAWGGKSLGVDFRPPSAGGTTGQYYNEMIRVVNDSLTSLDSIYSDYDATAGYEIAGLVWHQGWNDHINAALTAEYTTNLAYLINDIRIDLGSNFPVVVATSGMPTRRNAFNENLSYKNIELAQLAIANTSVYPEFDGNVALVDTLPFWISPLDSPITGGGQHFHWNHNAKTLLDIGIGSAEAFQTLDNSNPGEPGSDGPIEVLKVNWTRNDSGWDTVSLNGFTDPVVVASPLSANGSDPAHVRIKNVTASGFDYTVEEWAYLDGAHAANETISFLVLEKGQHTIGGKVWEAGSISGVSDDWRTVDLKSTYSGDQTILTQVASDIDTDPIVTRVNNINEGSFELRVQEEEANGAHNLGEIIHYIAVANGQSEEESTRFQASQTPLAVTNQSYQVNYSSNYDSPAFFAQIGSFEGSDPAALRLRSVSDTESTFFIEEETSADAETSHFAESIRWLVIDTE